jgi:Flp pilus assembly pilin Flp
LDTGRSKAEFRIAYGAIAAFGAYALAAGDSEVFKAVGTFWLGAAAVRLLAVALDWPRIDWTYSAFFVLEVAAALAAFLASG